jgi:hypothetical protein
MVKRKITNQDVGEKKKLTSLDRYLKTIKADIDKHIRSLKKCNIQKGGALTYIRPTGDFPPGSLETIFTGNFDYNNIKNYLEYFRNRKLVCVKCHYRLTMGICLNDLDTHAGKFLFGKRRCPRFGEMFNNNVEDAIKNVEDAIKNVSTLTRGTIVEILFYLENENITNQEYSPYYVFVLNHLYNYIDNIADRNDKESLNNWIEALKHLLDTLTSPVGVGRNDYKYEILEIISRLCDLIIYMIGVDELKFTHIPRPPAGAPAVAAAAAAAAAAAVPRMFDLDIDEVNIERIKKQLDSLKNYYSELDNKNKNYIRDLILKHIKKHLKDNYKNFIKHHMLYFYWVKKIPPTANNLLPKRIKSMHIDVLSNYVKVNKGTKRRYELITLGEMMFNENFLTSSENTYKLMLTETVSNKTLRHTNQIGGEKLFSLQMSHSVKLFKLVKVGTKVGTAPNSDEYKIVFQKRQGTRHVYQEQTPIEYGTKLHGYTVGRPNDGSPSILLSPKLIAIFNRYKTLDATKNYYLKLALAFPTNLRDDIVRILYRNKKGRTYDDWTGISNEDLRIFINGDYREIKIIYTGTGIDAPVVPVAPGAPVARGVVPKRAKEIINNVYLSDDVDSVELLDITSLLPGNFKTLVGASKNFYNLNTKLKLIHESIFDVNHLMYVYRNYNIQSPKQYYAEREIESFNQRGYSIAVEILLGLCTQPNHPLKRYYDANPNNYQILSNRAGTSFYFNMEELDDTFRFYIDGKVYKLHPPIHIKNTFSIHGHMNGFYFEYLRNNGIFVEDGDIQFNGLTDAHKRQLIKGYLYCTNLGKTELKKYQEVYKSGVPPARKDTFHSIDHRLDYLDDSAVNLENFLFNVNRIGHLNKRVKEYTEYANTATREFKKLVIENTAITDKNPRLSNKSFTRYKYNELETYKKNIPSPSVHASRQEAIARLQGYTEHDVNLDSNEFDALKIYLDIIHSIFNQDHDNTLIKLYKDNNNRGIQTILYKEQYMADVPLQLVNFTRVQINPQYLAVLKNPPYQSGDWNLTIVLKILIHLRDIAYCQYYKETLDTPPDMEVLVHVFYHYILLFCDGNVETESILNYFITGKYEDFTIPDTLDDSLNQTQFDPIKFYTNPFFDGDVRQKEKAKKISTKLGQRFSSDLKAILESNVNNSIKKRQLTEMIRIKIHKILPQGNITDEAKREIIGDYLHKQLQYYTRSIETEHSFQDVKITFVKWRETNGKHIILKQRDGKRYVAVKVTATISGFNANILTVSERTIDQPDRNSETKRNRGTYYMPAGKYFITKFEKKDNGAGYMKCVKIKENLNDPVIEYNGCEDFKRSKKKFEITHKPCEIKIENADLIGALNNKELVPIQRGRWFIFNRGGGGNQLDTGDKYLYDGNSLVLKRSNNYYLFEDCDIEKLRNYAANWHGAPPGSTVQIIPNVVQYNTAPLQNPPVDIQFDFDLKVKSTKPGVKLLHDVVRDYGEILHEDRGELQHANILRENIKLYNYRNFTAEQQGQIRNIIDMIEDPEEDKDMVCITYGNTKYYKMHGIEWLHGDLYCTTPDNNEPPKYINHNEDTYYKYDNASDLRNGICQNCIVQCDSIIENPDIIYVLVEDSARISYLTYFLEDTEIDWNEVFLEIDKLDEVNKPKIIEDIDNFSHVSKKVAKYTSGENTIYKLGNGKYIHRHIHREQTIAYNLLHSLFYIKNRKRDDIATTIYIISPVLSGFRGMIYEMNILFIREETLTFTQDNLHMFNGRPIWMIENGASIQYEGEGNARGWYIKNGREAHNTKIYSGNNNLLPPVFIQQYVSLDKVKILHHLYTDPLVKDARQDRLELTSYGQALNDILSA